jgi:tetratricopeptide (TPR) repeat protein
MYQTGTGTSKDLEQAERCFSRVVSDRSGRAEAFLGRLFGDRQDFARSRAAFEASAAKGYASASYSLGRMYLFGKGVPADEARAYANFEEPPRLADRTRSRYAGPSSRSSDAMGIAERLVHDSPDDSNAHAVLGWVASNSGRADDALLAYDRALQIPARAGRRRGTRRRPYAEPLSLRGEVARGACAFDGSGGQKNLSP